MTRYISILRGINVSGQKIIKMDALRKMYKKLNFEYIQTYVQSGNVIFSVKENDAKVLEKLISLQVEKEFGFYVPIMVLNIKTLEKIIENNPFTKDNLKETKFMYITFLADNLSEFDEEKVVEKKQPSEEIAFTSNAVYLYCPNGYGRTKLNNNFLETILNVQATTRNWKTTNELLKLAIKQYDK